MDIDTSKFHTQFLIEEEKAAKAPKHAMTERNWQAAKRLAEIDRERLKSKAGNQATRAVLRGGPLDGRVMYFLFPGRRMVLTSDRGACEYVRIDITASEQVFAFLTPELKEQLEFENALLQLGDLLNESDVRMSWRLQFAYNPRLMEQVRGMGFRWSPADREWCMEGSRSQMQKILSELETHPEIKIICEPIR